MAVFEGSGVALVTPFLKDKSVDFEGLDRLIAYHLSHQTDCIVVCGTTGEAPTLTKEEHAACIRFVVERVKERIPVVAGTGSNCTRTAVETSKEAVRSGVDGLLVVTPYYNKTTQDGLFRHYMEIAKEAKAPIIMYCVGGRTGLNLEPETAAKIFKAADNVVGLKDASGNIAQTARILYETDGKIDLYSGNDDQIVPLLSLGAKGVVSVLANVAPEETHRICANYFCGNREESLALQMKAMPLIKELFREVNPIPVKKAMELMGMISGELRMPLVPSGETSEKKLRKALCDFGIEVQ